MLEQTEIEFIGTPLVDGMEFLSELHNTSIVLDETALAAQGISRDVPINFVLSGITLDTALRIILSPHRLTYVVRDGKIVVTTLVP